MPLSLSKRIPSQINVARLWNAVRDRDAGADGKFVYGVLSTGVYCRPSCPSKRPHNDKVVFFPHPAAAEEQGFRPCKRCSPAQLGNPALRAIYKVCRLLDASISQAGAEGAASLSLNKLAASVHLSSDQLERTFRRFMGISPRQYADAQRIRRFKAALRKGDNVTTALYDAGFGSSSRLYERAHAHLGMTPAEYGGGGYGMQIRYTVAPSPLGKLLLAATAKGISALYLGKSVGELENALREEYPRAEIVRDRSASGNLRLWLGEVLKHLQGHAPHLDLPTDVQATAFQRRVWEELRRIPYGSTRTYADVARAIGQPAAVRAVARACATNPVSVVVPCHRVVRAGGQLAGYRWGLDRKRSLLAHEAVARKNAPKK